MKIEILEHKLRYWIILFLTSSALMLWGLTELSTIFSNIVLYLQSLIGFSLITALIIDSSIKTLFLIGLLIVAIRSPKLIPSAITIEIQELTKIKRGLKILGITTIALFVLGTVSNIAIKDIFQNSVKNYIQTHSSLEYEVYVNYTMIIRTIFTKGLIVSILFVLIKKIPIGKKESTKANTQYISDDRDA